jgi:hypothetical protein
MKNFIDNNTQSDGKAVMNNCPKRVKISKFKTKMEVYQFKYIVSMVSKHYTPGGRV